MSMGDGKVDYLGWMGKVGLMFNILVVIIAYFVYGQNLTLAVAFIGLLLFYDLLTLISFTPIVGVIISGLLMYFWATPSIFNLTM